MFLVDLLHDDLVRPTHRSRSLSPSDVVCVALRFYATGSFQLVIFILCKNWLLINLIKLIIVIDLMCYRLVFSLTFKWISITNLRYLTILLLLEHINLLNKPPMDIISSMLANLISNLPCIFKILFCWW